MLMPSHPLLTQPDLIVIQNLSHDIHKVQLSHASSVSKADHGPDDSPLAADTVGVLTNDDKPVIAQLNNLNDATSDDFQPTVFTGWDDKDISKSINRFIVRPYTRWARTVVRRPTDVVFLTHIITYLATSVPSAVYLFYAFSWPHAIFHWIMQGWYCGTFTLMLHNHIHNNGLLAGKYSWFDKAWPYVLEPLMGHTWDSYFYHHVKHHHVENNGPGDLSSTIRYQRDDLFHFLHYVGRFVAFVWIELPIYFLRKNRKSLAIRTLISEISSYLFIYGMAHYDIRATTFVLIIPLIQMRIGMMVGNWGQHALIDEVEPDSDFRSSITLIDVPVSILNTVLHTAGPLRI